MKKALIIYNTKSGHTKDVALQIKEKIEHFTYEVTILRDKDFNNPEIIKDYDLLILGSPTHAGGTANTLKRKLSPLLSMDLSDKKLITFSTCAMTSCRDNVVDQLEDFMKVTKIKTMMKLGYSRYDDKIEDLISKIDF
jgi:flavodoxin